MVTTSINSNQLRNNESFTSSLLHCQLGAVIFQIVEVAKRFFNNLIDGLTTICSSLKNCIISPQTETTHSIQGRVSNNAIRSKEISSPPLNPEEGGAANQNPGAASEPAPSSTSPIPSVQRSQEVLTDCQRSILSYAQINLAEAEQENFIAQAQRLIDSDVDAALLENLFSTLDSERKTLVDDILYLFQNMSASIKDKTLIMENLRVIPLQEKGVFMEYAHTLMHQNASVSFIVEFWSRLKTVPLEKRQDVAQIVFSRGSEIHTENFEQVFLEAQAHCSGDEDRILEVVASLIYPGDTEAIRRATLAYVIGLDPSQRVGLDLAKEVLFKGDMDWNTRNGILCRLERHLDADKETLINSAGDFIAHRHTKIFKTPTPNEDIQKVLYQLSQVKQEKRLAVAKQASNCPNQSQNITSLIMDARAFIG